MGSWRPVAAVLAVAALLWLAVLFGIGTDSAPLDRLERALPGVRAADVAQISLVVGAKSVSLVRTEAGFVTENARRADPEVVRSLLGALEYTFSRRRRGQGVSNPRRSLRVRLASGAAMTLSMGEPVADGALVWIGTDDGAHLIASSEADQLFPEPGQLLDARVFRDASIEVQSLIVEQGDRRLSLGGDPMTSEHAIGRLRVDRARLVDFLVALEAVVLLPGEAEGETDSFAVRVGGRGEAHMTDTGKCAGQPGRRAVSTQLGRGCVASRQLDRIRQLCADVRPFAARGAIDPNRRLTRARVAIAGESIEIDPDTDAGEAATKWLGGLADVTGEVLAGDATPRLIATVEYDRGESESVEIGADAGGAWVRLAGSGIRWRLRDASTPEISALSFRSRRLVDRDKLELRQLIVRRQGDVTTTYRRADNGAWSPELPIVGLDEAIAHLEAERFVAAGPAPTHALTRALVIADFDPPPVANADPNQITLHVGRESGTGCFAQLGGDDAVFIAQGALCAVSN